MISIHALRVEGDQRLKIVLDLRSTHFYPRPPGGGRLNGIAYKDDAQIVFLSTPSGWRATELPLDKLCLAVVFLSTPSGWRATQ